MTSGVAAIASLHQEILEAYGYSGMLVLGQLVGGDPRTGELTKLIRFDAWTEEKCVETLIRLVYAQPKKLIDLRDVLVADRPQKLDLHEAFDRAIAAAQAATDRAAPEIERTASTSRQQSLGQLHCLIDRTIQIDDFNNNIAAIGGTVQSPIVIFVPCTSQDQPDLMWRRIRQFEITTKWLSPTEAVVVGEKAAEWTHGARSDTLFLNELKRCICGDPRAAPGLLETTVTEAKSPIVIDSALYARDWSGKQCAQNLASVCRFWCNLPATDQLILLLFAVHIEDGTALGQDTAKRAKNLRTTIDKLSEASAAGRSGKRLEGRSIQFLPELGEIDLDYLERWIDSKRVREVIPDNARFKLLAGEKIFDGNRTHQLPMAPLIVKLNDIARNDLWD